MSAPLIRYPLIAVLVLYSCSAISQIELSGDYGYTSTTLPAPDHETFDAHAATWQVHIGGDGTQSCNSGTYPVLMRNYSGQTFLHGLIAGNIPSEVDTYGKICSSSAAILIRDTATNSTIEGVRIDGAYDAIRATTTGADNFTIKNTWISNNRARCLQNLSGVNGLISDSLFEGCSTGINIGSTDANSTNNQLSIEGLLLQVSPYNISTGFESGNILVGNSKAPSLAITNSTFAYSFEDVYDGSETVLAYIGNGSDKLATCENNQLLWMPNEDSPAAFSTLAPCFELISGLHAKKTWEQKRCHWINEHPPRALMPEAEKSVRRLPTDEINCDENTIDGWVILPDGDYSDDDVYNAEGIQFRKYTNDVVYDASATRFVLNNCSVHNPENFPGILGDSEHDSRSEVGCAFLADNPDHPNRIPLNRYPILMGGANTVLLKPLIDGQVPQQFNFQLSYYNSAAILIDSAAANSKIYGARINQSWDAIRVKGDQFIISDVYSTNTRDDCIENDSYRSGKILDSLFDACSVGLSIRNPNTDINTEETELIIMDRVLMRMTAHKTSSSIFDIVNSSKVGGLHAFKAKGTSPSIAVHNSTFAYDANKLLGANQLSTMLGTADNPSSKLNACSNNKILWFNSDEPPSEFDNLPTCFDVISGIEARNSWEAERCDWINRHPKTNVRRFDNELDECALPEISSLTASTSTLISGDTLTLNVVINDPDNENFKDEDILWFSSLDGELIALDSSPAQGNSISTNSLSVGTHKIRVQVTDASGAKAHQEITISVEAPPANLTLVSDLPSPLNLGNQLLLSANINGDQATNYLYTFQLKRDTNNALWETLQTYSTVTTVTWDTSTYPGKNTLRVIAKYIADDSVKLKSKKIFWVNQASPVTQVHLLPNSTPILSNGENLNISATAISTSSGPYEYLFKIKNSSTNTVTLLQDYSAINTYPFDSQHFFGKNRIIVNARRAGTADLAVKESLIVWVNDNNPATSASLRSVQTSPVVSGTLVELVAQGQGGEGDYEYVFQYREKNAASQWIPLQAAGVLNSALWDTTGLVGDYQLRVRVKNLGSLDRPVSKKIGLSKVG